MNAAVPVADNLFEVDEAGPHLIGSRCTGCGTLYFPQALNCRNSHCPDKRVGPEHLPARGTLISYTVQRYRPPPLFRMDDWAPYAIGLVDLGEGVEVMGMLTGVELDEIRIGDAVHLVLERLYFDEGRGDVVTYKFAPVALEGAGA